MKRFIVALGLAVAFSAVGSGCVVRERGYAMRRPDRCVDAYWIEGHYGPRGRWHPGHWHCRGYVDRIEIE